MATSTIKPKRGTTAQWAKSKRILEWNEWGVEETVSGEWILRVGDGEHEFLDLPKVIDTPSLKELVEEARNTYRLFFEGAEAKEERFEELSSEITQKHSQAISDIEAKGAETLATIPEDYTETYNRAVKNSRDIEFATSTATRNDKRLTNVEKALFKEPFVIDSSVAHTKDVPEDSLPYAEVTEIGGMTRKCTNLIYQSQEEETRHGVTFVRGADGGITMNGTAEKQSYNSLISSDTTNGTYTISLQGKNANAFVYVAFNTSDKSFALGIGQSKTFEITDDIKFQYIILNTNAGNTFSNDTYYITLNKSDTALPYEPYFEGLRSAPVTEVESVGVNMLPESRVPSVFTEFAMVEVNDILANHIGEKITLSFDVKLDKLVAEDWSFSVYTYQSNGVGIANLYTIKPSTQWQRVSFKTSVKDYGVVPYYNVGYIALYDSNFNTYSIKNMQITLGHNDLPYTPYFRNTLPIPEAVQNLDGYGWGVSDEVYNYVDWEKKQFVKNVGAVDLGTLNWNVNTSSEGYTYYAIIQGLQVASTAEERTTGWICEKYGASSTLSTSQLDNKSAIRYIADNGFFVRDDDYADAAAFKSAMSGVMLYYELEEPVITDISDILPSDNLLGVEGGGTVTMVNEHGFNVPSEVVYQLDTESEAAV